jgi:hypothetical protein
LKLPARSGIPRVGGIVSAWPESLSSQLVLHSAAYGGALAGPQLFLD